MGDTNVLQSCMLFLVCFFLISDSSSIAEKPPSEAILQNKLGDQEKDQLMFSPSMFATQLDTIPLIHPTIPIVNPTTPAPPTTTEPMTPTTPIINPVSPTPPTTTGPTTPTINPVSPTPPTTTGPTTPTINPVSPTPPTTTGPTPTTTTPASLGGAWCVAGSSASETALQVALDYACGYGGADCSALQPGASCYNPNTIRDHASYAFNDYYQKNPVPTSCNFGGAAMLTNTDPSSGNCHYASSRTTPTTPITPPSISSPVNPYPPSAPTVYGEPTGYGSEPTGTPSSVDSMSRNLVFIFTTTCLTVSLVAANYL